MSTVEKSSSSFSSSIIQSFSFSNGPMSSSSCFTWSPKKTKAEAEAQRIASLKWGTQNCLIMCVLVKLWMQVMSAVYDAAYYNLGYSIWAAVPTSLLTVTTALQLQRLKDLKVILKNKEIVAQRMGVALSMLVLQLSADVILCCRLDFSSSLLDLETGSHLWISSGALVVATSLHIALHRVTENIIQLCAETGGSVCNTCKNNPPFGLKLRERVVICVGAMGYLYIQFCYTSSFHPLGSSVNMKHLFIICITAVVYECSASKMVHTCVKHAEVTWAQGNQLDSVTCILVFISSHVTLFRVFFPFVDNNSGAVNSYSSASVQYSAVMCLLADVIRYTPQLIVWHRAFNLNQQKNSSSWFTPCVVCARKQGTQN